MRLHHYFIVVLLTAGILFFGERLLNPPHPLEGSWRSDDDTIFTFRHNGTFVGKDLRGILIWGNWVKIDGEKIGFQSLLHKSFYNPQYAVSTAEGMEYINSDSNNSIRAKKITESEASAGIDNAITSKADKAGAR